MRSFVSGLLLLCISASMQAQEGVPALLLTNAILITMDRERPDAFSGYMLVDQTGRIMSVEPGAPPATIEAPRIIDMRGRIVAPGFISAHSHLYMSPLRGLGHNSNLYGWFRAWDHYLRHTTAEDLYWFTLHGSLDFLRNGITTAYDFTYSGVVEELSDDPSQALAPAEQKPGPFEENQFRAKLDAGLRFIDSPSLSVFGSDDEIIAKYGALMDWAQQHRNNPLFLGMAISGTQQFAPTRRTARLEVRAMDEFGVINQSHFLESPQAVAAQQEKFAWYDEAGALGPDFIFGHFIHVNDAIVDRVAETGARMSWQPTSNGRLGDGIADVVSYLEHGIPVAMGLDDQSCTDISDPFQNMRIGLYTMRAVHESADAMSIRDVLFLQTLGSAEVLGVDDRVGSLEAGKFADFLVVDPRAPDSGSVYEPLASYVLAMGLRNLKEVWVGGQLVVDGTTLLSYEEGRVRDEIDARTERIRVLADGSDD